MTPAPHDHGKRGEQSTSSGIGRSLAGGGVASKAKMSVDASTLRRALRLIHCMQKERGASCAYCSSVANEGIHADEPFSVQVTAARNDTDVAMRLFEQCSSKQGVPTLKSLQKIRNLIDNSTHHKGRGMTGTGFHRILHMFNSLLSGFVHDVVVPHVNKPSSASSAKHRRSPSTNSGGAPSSNVPGRNRHRRTQTSEPFFVSPLAFLGSSVPDTANHPPQQAFESSEGDSSMRRVDSSPCFRQFSPPLFSHKLGSTPPSPPGVVPPGSPRVVSFEPGVAPAATSCPHTRMESLLQLLGCFVRLKESTGVERATLSSFLAMGRHGQPGNELQVLKQRMLNDLVLEVENQRGLVEELGSMVFHPSFLNIMALVQPSVEYGPQMAALQQKILSDFDLVDFQQDMRTEEFWELITVYIDRLHCLELLIMEEIECLLEQESAPVVNGLGENEATGGENGKQPTAESLARMLVDSSSTPPERAYDVIQKMPPEEVKEKLLSILTQQQNGSTVVLPKPDDMRATNRSPLYQEEEEDGALVGEGISMAEVSEEFDIGEASNKEWEINLYELQFLKRVGRGGAGTTYLAKWSGQEVAVKVASITEMGLQGWKSEVQSLQRLHHPNIIRLLGSVYNRSPLTYCLVLEYCDSGDLESALRRPTTPNFFFHVASSIANGMAYLHSRGVIHRDIKPGNVLLHGDVGNGNFIVKVTDFGVATTLEDNSASNTMERTAETGTYRWMSPEVIRHESYSNMADVYSFALLLWQLLTRESPFAGCTQIEAAGKVALEYARPPFPEGTPRDVAALIEICWSERPDDRLPFEEIYKDLIRLKDSLSGEEKTWLEASRGHPVYKKREEEPDQRSELPPLASKSRQRGASGNPEQRLITPATMMEKAKNEKKSLRRMIFPRKK